MADAGTREAAPIELVIVHPEMFIRGKGNPVPEEPKPKAIETWNN